MSAWENRAHSWLAVGLLALAAFTWTRPPTPSASGAAGGSATSSGGAPLGREVQSAIVRLERWVREATDGEVDPLAARLRLAALGKRGLPHGGDPLRLLSGDGRHVEALRWLLESDSIPRSEALKRSVRDALGPAPSGDATTPSLDPLRLDLLALATLAGISDDRNALGDATQRALRHVEREYQPLMMLRGKGTPSDAALEGLAREWDDARGLRARGAESLQLSAAIFRATAVMQERSLEAQARGHLSGILFRQDVDRRLYEHLLRSRIAPEARAEIRRDAVENLGQFVQTLFNAHLALRTRGARQPPRAISRAMSRARADLLNHLSALELPMAPDGHATRPPSPELLRTAVQALRGLRLSRVQSPLAAARPTADRRPH